MMYQAIPARCAPPSGFSAVSSALHSLPFAKVTCCIRVSFESGREMTSVCAGSAENRSRQQPLPAIVRVLVSSMQRPCGVSMIANVPDPGCVCLGGMAYWFTASTVFERLNEGEIVLSDDVFVSVQATSWLET